MEKLLGIVYSTTCGKEIDLLQLCINMFYSVVRHVISTHFSSILKDRRVWLLERKSTSKKDQLPWGNLWYNYLNLLFTTSCEHIFPANVVLRSTSKRDQLPWGNLWYNYRKLLFITPCEHIFLANLDILNKYVVLR